jgi:hypothetical protein
MFIPYYDEFGVYTTPEDIQLYANDLIEKNLVDNQDDLYKKCIAYFGHSMSDIIEYIIYGED